ncbi:hypothetical protein RESH_05945 [Rhodopirellula europaea SH398]|uniref:Uncharacterized protein n=2 Tax=Rhodopirellula europaea TaxID=1263866 RepID=M2B4L1_9BACT|nr:hypothetical protein RE6C_02619 [Rhodopirellula europaea 6C]EMI23442.1 hypothetical protein RESH_05945 [Rhodopirellula europaea SH398]
MGIDPPRGKSWGRIGSGPVVRPTQLKFIPIASVAADLRD